jgi:hypothetical protein
MPRVARSSARTEPVQLPAGPGPLEPEAGDGRQLGYLGRVVALVRHPNEFATGPDGADDLGGRRQQRHHPHAPPPDHRPTAARSLRVPVGQAKAVGGDPTVAG